ncbi:kinetochore scaffold 1 [Larimichthys crocea]|uniref:kinetochore scaffold 1 n=1 Tax=Larimichthys crocea TaxID=215358 RepID=UPI000F5EE0A1|nr:kinetochore scaffold 1 [Larimichthys crocea]
MEPLDPAKNDDSGGLSKRRHISSILKAPRKSIRYPEPEEQENVVEVAKPVERRNSRRVSFAPANNVLLFTKDVNNASPTRSPLQELMTTTATAAATQNRGQVAVMEDGVQQIMGMETLLNAPLHTSQQRDKVNFDTGNDYGEKTVMFSDDAFMDMTHSHTINIANDGELLADISLHNYDVLATRREKTVMFTADDGYKNKTLSHTVTSGRMDLGAEIRNVSSSVPSMDPGFENFLASLSKPSAPSINPVMTRMTPPAGASSGDAKGSLAQIKTQKAEVDKENQVPTSVSAAKETLEKSLNTSRKISESSLYPKDDVKADMSEAQTDRIRGLTDDNDPFQWLFPTQETHSHLDNRVSQTAEKTKPQQSSKTLASFNTKEVASLKNPSLQTSHQRHKVDFDTKDECREKTIIFTASNEFMDMTQSHTVNIASGLFAPPNQSNTRLEERKRETCGTPGIPSNGLDLGFKSFLASLSKTVPTAAVSSKAPEENRSLNTTRSSRESFIGGAENVSMDMTEAQTGRIVGLTGSDDPFQFLFPSQALNPHRDSLKSAEMTSGQKNIKPSLKTNVERHQVKFDAEDDCRDKTVRFSADDACMDVTRSGEKTVRFTANDAAMDMTQSHTVNIATDFDQQSHQNVDFLPACGEKTVRFTANYAGMDMTQSHTVNIATDVEPQSRHNVEVLPTSGEKTVKFTANDAGMDVTRSHTVNIATDSVLSRQDSNISSSHENMDFPLSVKKCESETCRPRRNHSLSIHSLDPGFKNSLSRRSGPSAYPVTTKALAHATPSPQETVNTNGFLDQLKMQKLVVDAEKEEAPGFVSAVTENPVNKTMIDDDVCMDMTEAQTGNILAQTCTDECSQDLQIYSDHLKNTEVTSQQSNEAQGSSNPDGVAITNCPDSLPSNETDDRKDPDPRSQPCSGSAVDHDVDAVPSRKSRRISLADVHSKVRRLSQMIKSAPESVALDNCTATLPQLEHMDMDKNPKDKTELELGLENTEENTQAQCLVEEEQTTMTTTTPFNLKTKQLMSRLSVGGFKAKLPQRSKPDDPKKVNSVGEHTRTITVNVTNQLNNFDDDVSDIYDEELGSLEDMSEMLDTRSPQKATEEEHPSQKFNMDEPLEDDVFDQDFISAGHGKKRPLPVDEDSMEDEKRMKGSMEMTADFDMGLQSQVVEYEGNITTAPGMTTQTTDYSNSSHTASIRCEATFNSTFKQSMFESQLEDYASDVQRKLDDGTITVLEFLKLFNIDFVIHNPRQSVLPGRLLSDTDRTPMDFLKDRHINRPKQMVYETNVLNLTEKVEGLKVRMRDLDKPLNIVNRPLWEEMRNSSEKELKSFGAKLKERNNLFRKTSKVQSHEMKEVLYSELVHANLEEQQKLRGTIEKADEMIRSLDDCIGELEAELAGVKEKGFDGKPSLKSCQEEMQKVTAALADNDRQISELEMQKKQNSNKLNRLKAETRNLESHITTLHMVNEWKFGEKRDNCTVYTFLHDTFHLQLVYEKSDGNDADHQPERKISHITFKHQLDDEESQGHACLVHKLLSQFTEGEASWVEKYPMTRHVPKLLHDVSLVVSRCRLLGEELRLLKMWGSLKLDILDISCIDTRVHIVFSSLKKFSKFEVIFSVSLTNHLCALQVQSFKNMIGNTTIQQIEEIVASFVPGKKLLTKIVKKIHESLLC